MRLIDADALMKEFAEFVKESNNSDFADVPTWNDAVSLLGSAPTVKTIPIEELFRFIGMRAVRPDGNVKYTDDLIHLKTFIDEWRMENEEGYRDEVNRWWAEHSSRFD